MCFTINNPTEDERDALKNMPTNGASYLVYQDEIGDNGTRHIQGYVEFTSQKRFATLKKSVAFARAHMERRRGTAGQASEYCKKKDSAVEGTTFEFGQISKQGKRSDLDAVKKLLDDGASMQDIANEHFGSFIRYHRAFGAYRNLVKPEIRDVEVIVLFGAPGTGKSYWAYHAYPDLWSKPPGQWFDTYQGEETILIDEMAGDHIGYRTLLRMCDRYPLLVPVKGDFVYLRHTRVIICSNFHPNNWYDMTRYTDAGYSTFEESPLYRRINCMVELKLVKCEKRFRRIWHIGCPRTFPISAYTHIMPDGTPPLPDCDPDEVNFATENKRRKIFGQPMDRSPI